MSSTIATDATLTGLISQLKLDPHLARRIELPNLLRIIEYANQKYYNEDESVFTDGGYDQIRDIYLERSGVDYMPAPQPTSGKMVKLPYYLGAMDKIKMGETRTLERWLTKYKGPYLTSAKLDGVSSLYFQQPDGSHRLYSRGSHDIGQDITFLIKDLALPPLGKFNAVRGEIIMSKKTFRENQFLKTDGTPYKNVRGTVSGLINSREDNYNRDIARACHFVVYELIEKSDIQPKPSQGLERLVDSGLKIAPYQTVDKLDENILSEAFDYYLINCDYDIDGVVFYNDVPYQRSQTGNPDYARAFKKNLDELIGETVVNGITWQCSRTKYFKPVLELEPVEINDVTIKRVTANNARYLFDNEIGIGSRVKIIRSGGVIPKILEVVTKSTRMVMPDQPYVWNSTRVDLVLDEEPDSPTEGNRLVNIKRIYYFLVNIGVASIGEKTVEKIYDSLATAAAAAASATSASATAAASTASAATAPDIKSFLELTVDQLAQLGPKTSRALVDNIRRAVQTVNLVDLMAASQLFGRGIGAKKLEQIMAKYPDFWKRYSGGMNRDQIVKDLLTVEGVAHKTAETVAAGYFDFCLFFKEIKSDLSPTVQRNGPTPLTTRDLVYNSGLFDRLDPNAKEVINRELDLTDIQVGQLERFKKLYPTLVTPQFLEAIRELNRQFDKYSPLFASKEEPIIIGDDEEEEEIIIGQQLSDHSDISSLPKVPFNIVLSDIKGKAQFEQAVKSRGGSTSSSVTNATSILVIGDRSVQTTKRRAAEDKIKQGRPIKIMTADEFVKFYKLW